MALRGSPLSFRYRGVFDIDDGVILHSCVALGKIELQMIKRNKIQSADARGYANSENDADQTRGK